MQGPVHKRNFLTHMFSISKEVNMLQIFFMIAVLVGLYFTTFVNYLLFHSLAEIFSIIVACSFFMITWNSKKYIKNQYILFIGIAYLFIALLDLLHTLAYKGMPIFIDYDYYANQLWIGARYLESITLIVAFYFMDSDRNPTPKVLFTTYFIITTLIVVSVFVWKIFPVCFVEGVGLTPFKKFSEYIICSILLAGIFLLHKNKNKFEPKIYRNVPKNIILTTIFMAVEWICDTQTIKNLILSIYRRQNSLSKKEGPNAYTDI